LILFVCVCTIFLRDGLHVSPFTLSQTYIFLKDSQQIEHFIEEKLLRSS
jgi:hypothetical protein